MGMDVVTSRTGMGAGGGYPGVNPYTCYGSPALASPTITLTSDNKALSTDNGFSLPVGQTVTVSFLFQARTIDGSGNVLTAGAWKWEGILKNVAGTISIVGTPVATQLGADTGLATSTGGVIANSSFGVFWPMITFPSAGGAPASCQVEAIPLLFSRF